jgi:hypothetical protein
MTTTTTTPATTTSSGTTSTGTGRPRVTFHTTLVGTGGKCGIVVPEPVVERLAAGRRPPVLVDLDGYQYRSTVAVMGGQCMIGVSAAVRAATGLGPGDPVAVTLAVADTPRTVDVPADLAAALAADARAGAFFATLSNSLQRYHVDTVVGAKTAETRARRIDKALELFRRGQKR